MKNGVMAALAAALILMGYGIGRASDTDETVVTVKVTSADHEFQSGYFTLGDSATVIVKPDTSLFRFLARQRDRTITVTFSDRPTRQLSRLER